MKIKVKDLNFGDRFFAYNSLWTMIDIDDETGNRIARKHQQLLHGCNESICNFELEEDVVFQPPILKE